MAPNGYSSQYGNGFPSNGGSQMQVAGPGSRDYAQPMPADLFSRWLAHLIDCIAMILVVPICILLSLVPILGGLLASAIYICYWALRDISGASLGKRALKLEVIQVDGTPPRAGPRVVRNITFFLPALLLIIPYVGTILFVLVLSCLFSVEILVLLTSGRRIGDRLAGTMVVKRFA